MENKNITKNYCLQCGNEISKGKKFCNSSCAAKYNNRNRKVSPETKEKISNSLRNFNNTSDAVRNDNGRIMYKRICKTCGNEFYSYRKDSNYCSQKCANTDEEIINKIKEKVKERIANGTFNGWNSRNITSYPEQFWERVLKNHNIKYVREDFSTKKYFIDFLIVKNNKKIDLEIDGKQHSYEDRIIHDKERDEFLAKNGYIVYRVPWNEIKSENGKLKMKEKIKKFIEFYNSL